MPLPGIGVGGLPIKTSGNVPSWCGGGCEDTIIKIVGCTASFPCEDLPVLTGVEAYAEFGGLPGGCTWDVVPLPYSFNFGGGFTGPINNRTPGCAGGAGAVIDSQRINLRCGSEGTTTGYYIDAQTQRFGVTTYFSGSIFFPDPFTFGRVYRVDNTFPDGGYCDVRFSEI